jgi:hypothetical protein
MQSFLREYLSELLFNTNQDEGPPQSLKEQLFYEL